MKNVKMILVLAIMSMSLVTFAQPPGGGRGNNQQGPKIPSTDEIETIVEEISGELELTTKQETLVLEMYKDHFNEINSKMEANTKPSREEMDTLQSNFELRVMEVFTDEQKEKYQAYLQEHKPKQKRH